jgi:putative two-component system response regulator
LDSAEEKMRALEAGADDLLTKPINRAELTVRLRSLLRIHKFNQELIGAESVALALARAVAAKDGYAHSHLEKVASYAVMLGKAMGLDAAELKIIKYGAILHNVGKIAIPDAVLEKTGPLSPREMAMFQQHPRIGCDICAPLKPLKPVLPIVRHHKEHFDGTGYPDGLRGDEIPLGAQIVGIVDVYTALTSNRPYRKAVPHAKAIASLRDQVRQGWLNADLVERFIKCLEESDHSDDSTQPELPDPASCP